METRKPVSFGLGLLLGLTTFAMPAVAKDYDLVINNGRVIDPETLFDDIANVGITDGRIVTISKKPLRAPRPWMPPARWSPPASSTRISTFRCRPAIPSGCATG